MPFVRIDLSDRASAEQRSAIGDAVHAVLVRGPESDARDRFTIIRALPVDAVTFDPHFLGGSRRDPVFVEVLQVRGYSTETEQKAFAAVAEELEAVGVRPDDVFVAVTENGPVVLGHEGTGRSSRPGRASMTCHPGTGSPSPGDRGADSARSVSPAGR